MPKLGWVVLLAVFAVTARARAQDPVRLPGVNVTATIEKPGARILVGIVVDTAGNPIAGAEVTVPDLQKRMYTRSDGTFRFDSVRNGTFEMRARKIGYAAQVRKFVIDSTGGVAQFSLLPIVQGLPSMVTTATRRGLSGTVADMGFGAIPDATVRVLGAGLHTTTDIRGNFFLPAETGRYLVSVEKDSFATKLVSVTIPPDSGRHVRVWLMNGGPIDKAHFWNIPDLRERQAWAKPQNMVLYTREDLARLKIEWIHDAVAMTGPRWKFTEAISRDCMVVVNGGPEIANLAALTIDDVESVEIYGSYPSSGGAATEATKSQARTVEANAPHHARPKGGSFVWIDQTRRAVIENGTRVCPGVYVWLKDP